MPDKTDNRQKLGVLEIGVNNKNYDVELNYMHGEDEKPWTEKIVSGQESNFEVYDMLKKMEIKVYE